MPTYPAFPFASRPGRALCLAWGATFVLAAACRPTESAAPPPSVATSDITAHATTPIANDPLSAALHARWASAKVTPGTAATDREYQRRVTLDLVGRIPRPGELSEFGADPAPDKRRRLVRRLLASEEFSAHWADVLTDQLLGGATKIQPALQRSTHAWLSDQLTESATWASMSRELLTVSGPATSPGPSGFISAHGRKGQVEALAGATARVFLGVSIECAQCHDHPQDDSITQRDFYAFAAYFARTRARNQKNAGGGRTAVIVDKRFGEMHMPTETDGPGERSGPVVQPAMLGSAYAEVPGQTRREALADSILASSLFADVTAGRVWAQLMGRALTPRDAAIQGALSDAFVAGDYDLRHLIETVVLCEAYARTSRAHGDSAPAQRRAFAIASVRPMSIQQLIRSLLVATGRDADSVASREQAVARLTVKARRAHIVELDDDDTRSADTPTMTVPQALFLLGGPLTLRGSDADGPTTLATILDRHEGTREQLDALMRTTLGRPATAQEHTRLAAYVDGAPDPSAAMEDVMHAVLLSSEFLSIH